MLRSFREREEFPFQVYVGNRETFEALNVTAMSTKIAVGRDGVITFREGYGNKSPQEWDQIFAELAGS